MSNRTCVLLSIGLSVLLAGCENGPENATVSGTVTVDGKPLEKGVISFVPAEGEGSPATVEIANGKYEVTTTVGKKLVQLSAPVVVDRRKEYNAPDAPLVEVTDESLPERFNSKTELTFEVQSGTNTKDWTAESKSPKR